MPQVPRWQTYVDRALASGMYEWRPPYIPSYWENPYRVARYYHVLQSLPPGAQTPDWLDRDQVTSAYEYLKFANKDKPWDQWQYLHPDDPGRQLLQNIPQPPDEFLWPADKKGYGPGTGGAPPSTENLFLEQYNQPPAPTYVPQEQAQIGQPSQAGMTDEQWNALPSWQRQFYNITGSPITSAAMGALPGALLGLPLGPVGVGIGAAAGAAAASWAREHPQGSLAKILGWLDVGAETVERTIGTLEQIGGSVIKPEQYGDFESVMHNLRDVWQAGRYAYNVGAFGALENLGNLFTSINTGQGSTFAKPGEVWGWQGKPVTPELGTGLDAVVKIRGLIDQGASMEELDQYVTQQYGMSGVMQDLMLHIVLDPLNFTGEITKGVTRVIGRGEIVGIKFAVENADLIKAAEMSHGLPETLQSYRTLVRIGNEADAEKLSQLGWATKVIAGLTQEGEDKMMLQTPPGVWSYLTHLTPKARVQEMSDGVAMILGQAMVNADDPEAFVKFAHAYANNPQETAAKLSMVALNSPDAAALPTITKDMLPFIDEMFAKYQETRWHNDIIQNIAKVTGQKDEEVLRAINKAPDADVLLKQYIEAARASGAPEAAEIVKAFDAKELTGQGLREILKVFTGDDPLPRTVGEWMGQTYAGIMDKTGEFGAKYFNVQPDPGWMRFGNMLKQAQNFVYLKYNPNYVVVNTINDFFTMAATGLYGYRPRSAVMAVWDRLGYKPPRLSAGFGIAGAAASEVDLAKEAGKIGKLGAVDILKKANFSTLSEKIEEFFSEQATTDAFLQTRNRLARYGVGYDYMPAELVQSLEDTMPGLARKVMNDVTSSLTQAEVESKIFQGQGRMYEYAVQPAAEQLRAAGLNISDAEVWDALNRFGLEDVLKQLEQNAPNEVVHKTFRQALRKMDDWITEQSKISAKARATHVAAQIKTEGFTGVSRLVDEEALAWAETYGKSRADWGSTIAKARENPDQASSLIAAERAHQRMEFDRLWRNSEATTLGIYEGLGAESASAREAQLARIGQADNWRGFFETKEKIQDEFFSLTKKERTPERWQAVLDDIDNEYFKASAEDVRLQRNMNDILVDVFERQHPEQAPAARTWREAQLVLHQEIQGRYTRFHETLRGLTTQERDVAWAKFNNEELLPLYRRFKQGEIDGIHGIAGTPGRAPVVPEMRVPEVQGVPETAVAPEAVPPVAPVAATPTITIPDEVRDAWKINEIYQNKVKELRAIKGTAASLQDAEKMARGSGMRLSAVLKENGLTRDEVRAALAVTPEVIPPIIAPTNRQAVLDAAYQHFIPTATQTGKPNDKMLLNIIRKYGGEEAAAYKVLDEVDPAVAERAFAARDAQKVASAPAIKADQVADLEARKAEAEAIVLDESKVTPSADARARLYDYYSHVTNAEQADELVKITDARAQAWAKANGKTVAEWYETHIGEWKEGPPKGEALFQTPEQQAVMAKAFELGGETDDILKAGFIGPDGRLVDLSERSRGLGFSRVTMHDLFAYKVYGGESGAYSSTEFGISVSRFLNETNSIRIDASGTAKRFNLNLEILDKPTRAQWNKIIDAALSSGVDDIWVIVERRTNNLQYVIHTNRENFINDVSPKLGMDYLTQGEKGAISFAADGRAILHAFGTSDLSTAIHETWHIFRRDLEAEDLRLAEEWAGVKDHVWEVQHEEKFARAGERYIADGIAPTPELAGVFQKLKDWLLRIYTKIVGSEIDVNITPELRGVFDRLLGGEGEVMPRTKADLQAMLKPLQSELQDIEKQLLNLDTEQRRIDQILQRPRANQVELATRWKDLGKNVQEQFDKYSGNVLYQAPEPPAMGAIDATGDMQTTSPIADMAAEGLANYYKPILKALEDQMTTPAAYGPTVTDLEATLDPMTLKALKSWLGEKYGEMSQINLASTMTSQIRRDASLLNYGRRYGFDNVLSMVMPYQFWYTRSALQWAMRAFGRPQWLANYARLRQFQRNVTQVPGFPTRLKDKIKINLPFMPSWAGDGIYVDPLKQIFPFEQFARPFEQIGRDKSLLNKRAEYVLQDQMENEEVGQTEGQDAIQTHQGPLWDKAMTQAKLEYDSEIDNPLEFVSSIMSLSLPLQWAQYALQGQPEKIGPLPITRMVRAVTSTLGINKGRGINIEGPIRHALGLPEVDRYNDFRVDRMLSNMAAEGVITPDEAQRAMIDRTGPAFLQAEQRVSKLGAASYFGAPAALDFFPEGEEKQRQLKQEYDRAWQAREKGDTTALTTFFNKYPEYEARLQLFKDPKTRMRQYLISQVWDGYHNLPDLYQKQMREQLGDQFTDAFLNKTTRSYDTIDDATLALWSKLMGQQKLETAPETPQLDLKLAPPETAKAYQEYRDTIAQQFPGINPILNVYYTLPQGPSQEAFAAKHPEIQEYKTWNDQYLAQHPDIIPFAIGEKNQLYNVNPAVQAKVYQYRATVDRFYPNASTLQDQYYAHAPGKDRAAFAEQTPELTAYWDFKQNFMAQNPDTIPYVLTPETLAKRVLGEDYISAPQQQAEPYQPTIQDVIRYMSAPLRRQLMGYTYANQTLGEGALMELDRIWKMNGEPYGDMMKWIEYEVKPALR